MTLPVGDHRKPPILRPAFIEECDERIKRNGMGYCKVCEALIPKTNGTPHKGRCICSMECRRKVWDAWRDYNAIYSNHDKRAYERDKGICQICKLPVEWADSEADHIKALCLLTAEDRLDPYWWSIDNIQTLHHSCHAAKTREDVAKLKALCRPDGTLFAEVAE